MPPPTAKKGVFIAGKNKKGPDPWCLVCGVNLRLDGRCFIVLTSDDAEETRKLFVQILGIQFQSDYASVNLCNKCERSLKRINRYAGLESAKSEAKALKKSLAENLKKKGQATVEASEAVKYEVNSFKGTEPNPNVKKSEPLIEDEAEDWKENQDREQEADDRENSDPNKEKENPEKPADTDETELKKLEIKDAPVKSENSPLINKNGDVKESKLQDSQPGMLCCTIL